MERPSLITAIGKLASAGEQAGFTVEQMIDLLDGGWGVVALLELIAWRREQPQRQGSLGLNTGQSIFLC